MIVSAHTGKPRDCRPLNPRHRRTARRLRMTRVRTVHAVLSRSDAASDYLRLELIDWYLDLAYDRAGVL
jgi:hypothetical protein